MRVVIADDSEPLRRVVAETVITLGGEVVGEAGDGYAAVVAAAALDPDVVIMDWQMPDLDGVAATEAIRQCRPAVEVIAYSAADDQAVAEQFRRAGASAYIDKADTAGLFAELKRRLTPAAISA
jgi:DNA-binding NarL/FixJ family response regulator